MTVQRPTDVAAIDDWSKLLDGRVAVVTGGGTGIGGAIARLFAEHGALVEIAEINPDLADQSRSDIEAAGGTVRAHVVDVTEDFDVERLARAVLDTHGRVDVLVNNVGDFRPLVRFQKSTPESWAAMYKINLHHFFSVTHAFLDSMIEQRRGSIVNVHSVEGMRGYPGEPVYGAMKAAVAHFTTCLAVDQGRNGIRVQRHRARPHADSAGRLRHRLRVARRPVAVMGAGRPAGLARRPGPRRALPGLRPVGLRDRPQHPGRRRHQGRRRLVLVAVDRSVRQPSHDPLSRTRAARHRAQRDRRRSRPRGRRRRGSARSVGVPSCFGCRDRASEGVSHRREVFGVAERVGSGHGGECTTENETGFRAPSPAARARPTP